MFYYCCQAFNNDRFYKQEERLPGLFLIKFKNMNKTKKFFRDLFRLTSAEELKAAVESSNYQRVAKILRWHKSLVNSVFSHEETEYEEGESWTRIKHATVLDYNNDPEMERLLRHFDAKTWSELEAEKERLRRKVEKQNEINQQEAKLRRQNGKAIVDHILGCN